MFVAGQGIGDDLIKVGSASPVDKGFDVDKYALASTDRLDKAVAFFIIPR